MGKPWIEFDISHVFWAIKDWGEFDIEGLLLDLFDKLDESSIEVEESMIKIN